MSKKTKNPGNLYSYFITLALVVGLVSGLLLISKDQEIRSRASVGGAAVYTYPESQTVNVNEVSSIAVQIDSGEYYITGVQLAIKYDPAMLSIDSVVKGEFLGADANYTEPIILSDLGLIDFSVFLPLESDPIRGSGTVAIISFTPKAEGSTYVSFTERQTYDLNGVSRVAQTQAHAVDETDNVISSALPGNIAVQVCQITNGDANGDGLVDGNDFTILIRNFDTSTSVYGGSEEGDFNCDYYVNGSDFTIFLRNFSL